MSITRNPTDTIEGIRQSTTNWRLALEGFKNQPGSQDYIERFRGIMETTITTIDQKMTALIRQEGDDGGDLTDWAARIASCVRMFDVLDRNIPFKGRRQWNWDEVIDAMAFLKAVEQGAQLTLYEYGIE